MVSRYYDDASVLSVSACQVLELALEAESCEALLFPPSDPPAPGAPGELQLRNTQAVLMLLRWLPDVQQPPLQEGVARALTAICGRGNANRMVCCYAGVLAEIIKV